jgi:inositol polyphosphate 5-phosphatase INPP5B/F
MRGYTSKCGIGKRSSLSIERYVFLLFLVVLVAPVVAFRRFAARTNMDVVVSATIGHCPVSHQRHHHHRRRRRLVCAVSQARCFVGTWNVNAKGKEESLDEWLRTREWGQTPPDIIVAGFQEIVDLNAVNVAVDNKTQQRSQFWIERLRATLPHNCYTLLAQKSMVGLLICVFVRNDHHGRVQYVQTASVGVGVLGMGGNKGGVSIRLQFYDSCLCFVCSHLAAHRENVVGRNQDAHNILAKTNFEIGEDAIRNAVRSGSLSHWTMGSSTVKIADHDAIVWLGDLNYRIDDSLSTEQVLHAAENNRLQELRVLDQLNVERAAGRVLEDYIEGPLNFPPTYKYQPGTEMYEQRPDKKLRAPAWCDRILYSSVIENTIQQLSYGRSERPNCSDHKPVYSMLQMTIKDVIPAKREAIYEELMKVLDQYENQTLPAVGLDRVALDFGPIKYEEQMSLPIQITNVGSVAAQWRLVPKPDEVSTLFWPQNVSVGALSTALDVRVHTCCPVVSCFDVAPLFHLSILPSYPECGL